MQYFPILHYLLHALWKLRSTINQKWQCVQKIFWSKVVKSQSIFWSKVQYHCVISEVIWQNFVVVESKLNQSEVAKRAEKVWYALSNLFIWKMDFWASLCGISSYLAEKCQSTVERVLTKWVFCGWGDSTAFKIITPLLADFYVWPQLRGCHHLNSWWIHHSPNHNPTEWFQQL